MAIYRYKPYHPGVVHYIIHSYDYAALAKLALPAAKRYASISAILRAMRSICLRISSPGWGFEDEDIQSNIVATNAARCYGENMGIKGHWDEELHWIGLPGVVPTCKRRIMCMLKNNATILKPSRKYIPPVSK